MCFFFRWGLGLRVREEGGGWVRIGVVVERQWCRRMRRQGAIGELRGGCEEAQRAEAALGGARDYALEEARLIGHVA